VPSDEFTHQLFRRATVLVDFREHMREKIGFIMLIWLVQHGSAAFFGFPFWDCPIFAPKNWNQPALVSPPPTSGEVPADAPINSNTNMANCCAVCK